MESVDMGLVGGALVIGSLYWDSRPERKEWRESDLSGDRGMLVRAQIRYGRYSAGRKCYTMVFSPSLCSADWGRTYAMRHHSKTEDSADLEGFATRMAEAEGISGGLVSDWRSVGLLINPSSPCFQQVQATWRKVFEDIQAINKLLRTFGSEDKASITKEGYLTIEWPMSLDSTPLSGFDYLLATANLSRHKDGKNSFPSCKEIAGEMRGDIGDDYFLTNRKHNIAAFQDAEVIGHIR